MAEHRTTENITTEKLKSEKIKQTELRNVILDVDTGSDDAIAIMLALRREAVKVRAICTVSGNLPVDNTTDNTLRLLWSLGADIPVYRGLSAPLVRDVYQTADAQPKLETVIDGETVRMHENQLNLPESEFNANATPAVFYYRRALTAPEEPIHIITTGPLSNLGTVLSLWPELAANIASLTIMGGGNGVYNNQYGEGNFRKDPEAAQIVLDSGCLPTIVSLDATHRAIITEAEIGKLRSLGSFSSRFSADLLEQRMKLHTKTQPLFLPDSATLHDAVAVGAFIDPEILQDVREVYCQIGLTGYARGHCSLDRREGPNKPNCRFAMSADRERFIELLLSTFEN